MEYRYAFVVLLLRERCRKFGREKLLDLLMGGRHIRSIARLLQHSYLAKWI